MVRHLAASATLSGVATYNGATDTFNLVFVITKNGLLSLYINLMKTKHVRQLVFINKRINGKPWRTLKEKLSKVSKLMHPFATISFAHCPLINAYM
jgi:hypothetical protein